MKIVFIMPGYVWKPSGSHRVVYEYANRLADRGHQITIIYPQKIKSLDKKSRDFSERIKEQYRYLRRLVLGNNPRWFKLHHKIERLSIPEINERYIPDGDAIIATTWYVAEYINIFKLLKGKKYYFIHHDETIFKEDMKERILKTLKMPFCKIAVSQHSLTFLKAHNVDDIAYIPNGIDHSKYRIINPIDNRTQSIAMCYVPRAIKDPGTGIKAICEVKKSFPRLQVKFFGISRRDKAIPKWIEYYRECSDDFLIKDIYNSSAIFLCSSILEGFCLPAAEAMACGCALISTDCGGIRDFAYHGMNALLSPVRDVQSLTSNLIILLRNDILRQEIADAGNKTIQKFNWEESTQKLEALIREKAKK